MSFVRVFFVGQPDFWIATVSIFVRWYLVYVSDIWVSTESTLSNNTFYNGEVCTTAGQGFDDGQYFALGGPPHRDLKVSSKCRNTNCPHVNEVVYP